MQLKDQQHTEMIALSEACAAEWAWNRTISTARKTWQATFENVGYSLPGKACLYNIFDHGGVSNDRRLRRRNYHKSGVPV